MVHIKKKKRKLLRYLCQGPSDKVDHLPRAVIGKP